MKKLAITTTAAVALAALSTGARAQVYTRTVLRVTEGIYCSKA